MSEMMKDAGRGHEQMTAKDMALPFLYLLQDLSPQVKPRNEAYVDGAQAGMFFENISQTLWEDSEGEGVLVVPCFFSSVVIEWVKRIHGGGFVAIHPDMATAVAECKDPEKNQLVDTHQHFCLVQKPDGSWTQVLFPLSSTKLKNGRKWNAALAQQVRTFNVDGQDRKIPLPRFGCVWRVRSAATENEKGEFFTMAQPQHVEDISERPDAEELYQAAKAFYTLCNAGAARVDYAKYQETAGGDGDGGEDTDPTRPKF
jgi:hypothetical protein